MRQIDGKYSAVIVPPKHSNTCNANVATAACTCAAKPRVAIINTATGVEIPEDEPLILFRGKDVLTRGVVEHYRDECYNRRCRSEHTSGISAEITKLNRFAAAHPERMKVPD